MMYFQRATDLFLQKRFEIFPGGKFFQTIYQIIVLNSPVRASSGAETVLNAISSDFRFHIFQKLLLRGTDMIQADLFRTCTAGLFLHSFSHPFPHKKWNPGNCFICFFCPLHSNLAPNFKGREKPGFFPG